MHSRLEENKNNIEGLTLSVAFLFILLFNKESHFLQPMKVIVPGGTCVHLHLVAT